MEDKREPINEVKYTVQDMLDAFKHGRNYDPLYIEYDMDYADVDEKHIPFFEWLIIRGYARYTSKSAEGIK